jgi:ATP-dependent RNA helicase DDX51/DBP6
MVISNARQRPLMLLGLLEQQSGGLVLIFTSSVDSTHRLCRLLQLVWSHPSRAAASAGAVAEFSSALTQQQRADLIRRCLGGAVRVLISSDSMARGIDLPDVAAVINYDVPTHAKTYVHRVGRTARAGKAGASYTILKRGQERQFLRMREGIDGKRVLPFKSSDGMASAAPLTRIYRKALPLLKAVLVEEKAGKLHVGDPVDRFWAAPPVHAEEDGDEESESDDEDGEEVMLGEEEMASSEDDDVEDTSA